MSLFFNDIKLIENLNHHKLKVRLQSLKQLADRIKKDKIQKPKLNELVNNHIHTMYSFSPYSPTKAIWMAYNAGLSSAGIVDHDSIGGACEFLEAAKIIGIAATVGLEVRADFSMTKLNNRGINNPDQKSIGYMAIHGIPHNKFEQVAEFLAPLNLARNKRNELMTDKINEIMKPFEIFLDFEDDVYSISMSKEEGSITERHILFALSKKIITKFGKGEKTLDFVKNKLKINVLKKQEEILLDVKNPYYLYDLLGVLKSSMVEQFYINATDECPPVKDLVIFAESIGAILAYAYLGDIEESVTGDKKKQRFEDEYLDELFVELNNLGFKAITYMPTRNSLIQLQRVKNLCLKYNFLEICGEDINNPRQSFICDALYLTEFKNLIDTTWAIIGHEKAATADINKGFFSDLTIEKYPDIGKRIEYYKNIGYRFLNF